MKRKKVLVPITEPDRTNESISYWNSVLESHGLGLLQGATPRTIMVGSENDLVHVETKAADRDSDMLTDKFQNKKEDGARHVTPRGKGPDC
jgi:hypothetical protein